MSARANCARLARSGFSAFGGKGLWATLDQYRVGPERHGVFAERPGLAAEVKFFGRYKGGAIRDGVILSLEATAASIQVPPESPDRAPSRLWCCDCNEALAAFDG